MTLTQVGGALLIFVLCPLLGGLPLIHWLTYLVSGQSLPKLGTGNVSVSAAFYHGGPIAGLLAVAAEASKGIAAVLLARSFFPAHSEWEIIALITLVFGRYTIARGAGTTNVAWGYAVHDWMVTLLVLVIGGIGFTLVRERQLGKYGILILVPFMTALLHPDQPALAIMAILLAIMVGWIYQKIPDDLDLNPHHSQKRARSLFQFFRADRAILSLDQPLKADKVGQKAARLSHLRRSGYPVPQGWLFFPGDDPDLLIALANPSVEQPLVVRSSAIGEDSDIASSAGQYKSVLDITQPEQILPAIVQCLESYDRPSAIRYRRDRALPEAAMVVLVQKQVRGVFSGVAFSRDPIARQGEAVVIEALPGGADRVVSGQVTPERYRVLVAEGLATDDWQGFERATLPVEGSGMVPLSVIRQVAFLARHLEAQCHGIPQDIEWSFDGENLWLLQARSITTLLPIWTRKIAAEVIPGAIRPLTWSINQPLTCGVWGEIFTLVLGEQKPQHQLKQDQNQAIDYAQQHDRRHKKQRDRYHSKTPQPALDFSATATLHHAHAYFNASLLGEIFRRMGLPPESLEFLTRGAKFTKPPLRSTLQNLPGLFRLLKREWRLEKDFRRDDRQQFSPVLTHCRQHPSQELSIAKSFDRIDTLLSLLRQATYYSILAPLSAALRQAIARVPNSAIDPSQTPEVAALRSLQTLATQAQAILPNADGADQGADVFADLALTADGQRILVEFDRFLQQYGYLSEVGTDIAVPTWREDPEPVRQLFQQFCRNSTPPIALPTQPSRRSTVQRRMDLKGHVTAVYSQLLAELRACLIRLETIGLETQQFQQSGDIFFLTLAEVRQCFLATDSLKTDSLATATDTIDQRQQQQRITQRRSQFTQHCQRSPIPALVYGDEPPEPQTWTSPETGIEHGIERWQGIGASPGQRVGRIQVMKSLVANPSLDRETILVVPYTDSGWAPLLAQVGGLISEVGGSLSHGAIVAREYQIPAVMDIPQATHQFRDGQWVRLDGGQGTIELLPTAPP